jgi:DNA uptake protein ComE-like DNA-binding protein
MRILLLLLCLLGLGSRLQAEDKVEGEWEVLTGCRLQDAFYNDGDSFSVKCGSETYSFRLYFVDALETSNTYMDRIRAQADYFSIQAEDVTDAGDLATKFTQKLLRGSFTVITRWEDARGSRYHKRYYALIQKNDQYLSSELVNAGLARIYGMPTKSKWPSGMSTSAYQSRLKKYEREAKREKRGIWADTKEISEPESETVASSNMSANEAATEPPNSNSTNTPRDGLNLNTATQQQLETLPRIGPALASRIINARPIEAVDNLVEIPGISSKVLEGLRHLVIVKEPPPPSFTVAYYKTDLAQYLNQEVTVRVASVTQSEVKSPDSFRSATLETAYEGETGGEITVFIPDEFYESFLNYYQEPEREFTGLLYEREGEVVMVYVRK